MNDYELIEKLKEMGFCIDTIEMYQGNQKTTMYNVKNGTIITIKEVLKDE